MKISDFNIGSKKVFVIAEIGNNHNGSFDMALEMIDAAVEAGADCVKFQMRNMKSVYREKSLSKDGEDLGIPITYVPARNTIFLSHALGFAEAIGARDIFIGVNAVDYSGYPDCRGEYIQAFQSLANLATKAGVEGDRFTIHAPLLEMTKVDIIKRGHELGIDYSMTQSCYDPSKKGTPCGRCDACRLRDTAFAQTNLPRVN